MFKMALDGLMSAVRNYRLVLVIWACQAGLACAAAVPALNWWRRAFDHSIEAAALLDGFNFGVLADLTKYDQAGAFGLLGSAMAGAVALAMVASPFVMGGTLSVLSGTHASRGALPRFFSGGGEFFWRFFRLMLLAGTCTVVVGGLMSAALAAVEAPLSQHGSEATLYLWAAVNLAWLAMTCGVFVLALDYARIQIAKGDTRGVFGAYMRAVGFVVRRALTTYPIALVFVVPSGALLLGYLAYETVSPVASGWGLMLALFAVQQVVVLLRIGLRVSLVAAECRLVEAAASAVARGSAPAVSAPASADAAPLPPMENGTARGAETVRDISD
ncbi:MAG: hypothetical protein WCP29_17800 [Acidobacteriota bacterium]